MSLLSKLTGSNNAVAEKAEQLGASFNINLGETVQVTIEKALQIPAFAFGINLICDTIASMPIHLYDKNGKKLEDDYRCKLLNFSPNQYTTSYNLKYSTLFDFLVYGNGYIYIDKDFKTQKIKSLIHIPYKDIDLNTVYEVDKRKARYFYNYWDEHNAPVYNVLNIVRNPHDNPLVGIGVLEQGFNTLKLLLDLEDYQTDSIDNKFTPRVVIEKESIMSRASKESFRDSIKNFFSGSKGSKVLLLDDGMKAKSLNAFSDNAVVEQKNDAIKNLAMLLKLPHQLFGITGGNMSYNNESYNTMMLLKQTIEPILKVIEDTMDAYLLTESEKESGCYWGIDTSSILRVDPKTEYEMYGKAIADNILLVNEVREKLNLEPLKDQKTDVYAEENEITNNFNEQPTGIE